MRILLYCCLLTIFSCGNAHSYCSEVKSYVVHINGIATSEVEARSNAESLGAAVEDVGGVGTAPTVIWAYNDSSGAVYDSFQSIYQKLQESYISLPAILVSTAVKVAFFWDLSGLTDIISDSLQSIVRLATQATATTGAIPRDTANILADIVAKTSAGSNLVIVPHSQGNFYANALYDSLKSRGYKVNILSIATPSAYTAGSGDFVTSLNDLVVGAIGNTRGWNITIPKSDHDQRGHSFEKIYLSSTLAVGRSTILSKLQVLLSNASAAPLSFSVTASGTPFLEITNTSGPPERVSSGTALDVCGAVPNVAYILWAVSPVSLSGSSVLLSLSDGQFGTALPEFNFDFSGTGYKYLLGSVYVDATGKIFLQGA